MELLHENSLRPQQVDYICKKGPAAVVWLVYNMQYLHLAHLNKGQSLTI